MLDEKIHKKLPNSLFKKKSIYIKAFSVLAKTMSM